MASALNLGSVLPDFQADSSMGEMSLYEHFSDSWGILFSHPADYTPICTTELGEVAAKQGEWEARNVKVAAISCDTAENHRGWLADIKAYTGNEVNYPIFCDPSRDIAVNLGMLDESNRDAAGLPLTVRKVFIVDQNKVIKLTLTYPAATGRNFDEILRAVDALQLTAKYSVATPVNWKAGEAVVILPHISSENAAEKFGEFTTAELPSGKPYLRVTSCPSESKAE